MRIPMDTLAMLYGDDRAVAEAQRARYEALGERFRSLFPAHETARFFSAPGRTEIGGNHTDHQSGRVLAAAVNLDTVAAAARNDSSIIRVYSEGYPPIEVDIARREPLESEKEKTAAIIRGCAARMAEMGYKVGGFDAAVTSSVFSGSGLSSSAAFEIMVCAVLDGLFGQGVMPPVLRAQISQYAENNYFGKASGLMDQTASSVGKLVSIDFRDAEPVVEPIAFDFAAHGYTLAVVNTRGNHGDLSGHYNAITGEMKQVAAFFGEERLRPVDPALFYEGIPALREKVSDRAVLRAMHFFDENARVALQVEALKAGDLARFLALIIESGESSWRLLQNVWAEPDRQPLSLALALSERMLRERGAWRVHGGGFAGTILAFVPFDLLDAYRARMDAVFGADACCPLRIRPVGAHEIVIG